VTACELTVFPFTVKLATTLSVYGAVAVGVKVPIVNTSPPLVPAVPVIPVSVVPFIVKVQVTEALMSVPPWSFAVRVNPALVLVLWLDGVTVMEVTLDGTTVSVVVAVIVGSLVEVAVIVVVPAAMPVANPVELLILATVLASLLLQLTGVLPLLPSSKTPTTENCCVLPGAWAEMVGVAGVMASDVSVGSTKNPLQLAPKARTTNTAKARVNGSFQPLNITNRLEYLILAERPALPGSSLAHVWSLPHGYIGLPGSAFNHGTRRTVDLAGDFRPAAFDGIIGHPAGDAGSEAKGRHPRDHSRVARLFGGVFALAQRAAFGSRH
jgi:hypothetical protein